MNIYLLNILENTGNILHKYLYIFTMNADMDNLSTKPSPFNYISVNGIPEKQKFNMNHIYLQTDILWLDSIE